MADTTFTNGATLTDAGWFNDVNDSIYDGTTAQMLVGGGATVKAVWTTATGTGAPVRAGGPTLTGNLTFSAASASIIPGATSLLVRNNANSASNLIITDAGEITQPLQPAFLVNAGAASDVTGNNTLYTVVFGTEIFDQGGDFAANTFTAPVTGRYQLNTSVELDQLSGATSAILDIVTSNRTYRYRVIKTMGATEALAICALADMDAADTAVIKITVNGIGADTADNTSNSYFSGALIC